MEGKPNQLYAQGMRSFEQYDKICKYFAEGRLANDTQAQLQLYDVSLGEYLRKKSQTHETRASFTIPKYKMSLSLWKVSQISYMLKE